MGYKATDKMFDVICDEFHLLQMMSRFGIPMGFGEKTVSQVCEAEGVDTKTFLAVANHMKHGPDTGTYDVAQISVRALTAYLRQAHAYFLDYQLPAIRRKLIAAIDCASNEVAYLILRFYDEYMGDVRRHMAFEEKRVFSYVEGLLEGKLPPEGGFRIGQFARSHVGIDKKLQELKNLIIKYYKAEAGEQLNSVLFDIFTCEADLRQHCAVEDNLFVPAVEHLEMQIAEGCNEAENEQTAPPPAETLSEREKEIVGCIVRGMSGKEIADKLFISVNTVMTHRKNIFRKLNIHSVSGLTIYAIVGGIVRLDEVKL